MFPNRHIEGSVMFIDWDDLKFDMIVEVKMDYLTAWDTIKLFFLLGRLTADPFYVAASTDQSSPVEVEITEHCERGGERGQSNLSTCLLKSACDVDKKNLCLHQGVVL